MPDNKFVVNEEGYLKDENQWGDEWLSYCVEQEGLDSDIGLTYKHLKVINIVRFYYKKHGVVPMVVSLKKHTGMPLKELYELFEDSIYSIYKFAGAPSYMIRL